jgi:DNA-binding transcriptional MerR regulator
MHRTLAARGTAQTHPIQVVARRTGLSPDVIRAWEKRYAVVAPVRTETGRRLYSDADIERLGLLARVTLTGRTIGQVAGLPTAQLATLISADDPAPAAPAGLDLHAYLEAVGRFDAAALDALLRRAVVTLSAEAFLDALVVPFWERIGERMRAGTLRDSQRHLALAVLRRALYRMIEVATSPLAAPDLLVANQSVQAQDLGALLAAAAAAAEGWRVTHVGPGLPAAEIAETAARIGARAVLLSLGTAPTDRVLPRELRQLRGLLARDVNILVEGAGGNGQRGVSREIGATIVRDLPALRAWLRTEAAAS